MIEPIPWHRLFALSLVDFFRGMPVQVEYEKDLSLKQQLLDVAIIRKESGPLACRLPDGLEDLAAHNLVTFKSYQETLAGWFLNELIGHYVNYRKQVSPSMDDLLPESDFRLFAVAVRFPQTLARESALTPVRPGVYDIRHFTGSIRVVVVHELPLNEQNAMLHLFSARPDLVRYGTANYQPRSKETSRLLLELLQRYREEAQNMTGLEELAELTKHTIERLMRTMPVEERLKGVPAEERIKGLSVDELLAALSPEARAALAQRLRESGSFDNADRN